MARSPITDGSPEDDMEALGEETGYDDKLK